jgi:transcriptional regulator with XRE-family HTH domain
MNKCEVITKAELARQLGVSRAYITMLCNGKRMPSKEIVNKLHMLGVNNQIQKWDLKSALRKEVWVRVPPSALQLR